jgi:nicotinamide-nucleotide amidase
VAAALADGARRRCGAGIGIGLTGVAGPDPQDGVRVGTWFCAVSGPGEHRADRRGSPQTITESDLTATSDAARRGRIRAAAVRGALDLLANIAATHS